VYVQLRDFRARPAADVLDLTFHSNRLSRRGGRRVDLYIGVFEVGVRQTKSERKPGFDRGMIIASIAHKNAFRVVYRLPSVPRRIVGGGWIVSKSPLEGNRQFARRIYVASQQRRQSASSLLARVPGVQQNRNLIQPGIHINVTAGK
jgi:hypothetical protein